MDIIKQKVSLKVIIPMYLIAFYCSLIALKGNLYYQHIIRSIFSILGLTIATVYLYDTYKKDGDYRKYYWLLLALSVFSYTIAECIWLYYESILKLPVPIPSITDVFYLLQYPLAIGGLLYLIIKSDNKIAGIRLFLDTAIIIIIGSTIMFSFYHPKVFNFSQLDKPEIFTLMTYPLGDIVLLFDIVYLLMLSRDVFPRRVVLVGGIGFLLEIVMDILYLHKGVLSNLDYIYFEPIMILPLLFLALSGEIYLNKKIDDEAEGDRETKLTTVLLPYIVISAIIASLFFKFDKLDFLDRGLVITIFLIIIRQVLTIIKNQDLFKQLMASNLELKEKKLELEKANSELRKFYLEKEQESQTDFLTGLYNRRYIDEKFNGVLNCKIVEEKMSVLLVDIDYFKVINDTYGHDVGDMVLKNLSEIMKRNIRADDILIRFGGEEFICFLPNTDIEVANIIAERLRREVEEFTFKVDDKEINITISIGVSEIDSIKEKSDISSIIVEADKALYKAKRSGRNKVMRI